MIFLPFQKILWSTDRLKTSAGGSAAMVQKSSEQINSSQLTYYHHSDDDPCIISLRRKKKKKKKNSLYVTQCRLTQITYCIVSPSWRWIVVQCAFRFLQRVALRRSLSVCRCGGASRRRPTRRRHSGWAHFLRFFFSLNKGVAF